MLQFSTLVGYPIISDMWLSRFGSSHNVTDCQLTSATVSLIVRCRELCSFCITYLKRKALGTKYSAKRVRWSRLRRSADPPLAWARSASPGWSLGGTWLASGDLGGLRWSRSGFGARFARLGAGAPARRDSFRGSGCSGWASLGEVRSWRHFRLAGGSSIGSSGRSLSTRGETLGAFGAL